MRNLMLNARTLILIDIAIFVGFALLFSAIFGFESVVFSWPLVTGGACWGVFFAYALLLGVKRDGSVGFWNLSIILHLVISLGIATLGTLGLVYGNVFENGGSAGVGFIVLGVGAILAINMFKLIKFLTEKLNRSLGLSK